MAASDHEDPNNSSDDKKLKNVELGEKPVRRQERRRLMHRQKAERFQFGVLATELGEEGLGDGTAQDSKGREWKVLRNSSVVVRNQSRPDEHKEFWRRMLEDEKEKKDDRFYDMAERQTKVVLSDSTDEQHVEIPSLRECHKYLRNEETEKYRARHRSSWRRLLDLVYDILAAFYIWIIYMLSVESLLVIVNAGIAAAVFCEVIEDHNVKLDFSFLAFAVVFPLTFLMQSTFARREQALGWLADFKAALLSTALMTLTVDWASTGGDPVGGRSKLPDDFNSNVVKDCCELVVLVYRYLSMPNVAHARNVVFWAKQSATKRVHALQNDIIKHVNDSMYDLSMQTEEMRKYGFPSGEASRLHQYHSYLQQRFEHLRAFKYYRTPQATRSFGRAYIFILPWLCGPYWVWVKESTSLAYSIVLACVTFLIMFGLLNAQKQIEDPFTVDARSLFPGIDVVKLDFEMAVVIQAIEQYYASAELKRKWEKQGGQQERMSL